MKRTRFGHLSDSQICDIVGCTVDKAPIIFFVLSLPGYRFLYANTALTDILRAYGLKESQDILGLHARELLPDWQARLFALCEEVRASGEPRRVQDLEYRMPDRVSFWDATLVPGCDADSGRVTSIATFAIEVTDRKQAVEDMLRHRELCDRIVENTDDGVIVFDTDLRYTLWNPGMERISGVRREEVLGKRVFEVFPFLKETGEDKFTYAALAGETGIASDRPHILSSGKRGFMESRYSPLRDEDGLVVGGLVIIRDTTAQKAAADKLRESEEQYRTLVEMIREGLARADEEYRITYVNEAFAQMLGYARKDMIGRKVIDFVHEDDRAVMVHQMARRREGKTDRFEMAWRSGTGGKVYTLISPRAVLDEAGEFAGSVAVLTDITERRRVEEALSQSEERYRLLFESNPLPMWVYDLETLRILAANDAAVSHYGYSREEFVRLTIRDIRPADDVPALMENLRRASDGIDRAGVWRHIRKDGTLIRVEITSHTLTWDGRRAELVLANDVTERMRAEEERDRLQDHQREFYRHTISAATGGKLVVCDRDQIEELCGVTIGTWRIRKAADLSAIRHKVQDAIRIPDIDVRKACDLILCVGEATTNALKHAGKGVLTLHQRGSTVMFTVSDEGPGIDALALPYVALTKGYSTAVSLGMGYKAMLAVSDRVYLATGPDGTLLAVEMDMHGRLEPVSLADQLMAGL